MIPIHTEYAMAITKTIEIVTINQRASFLFFENKNIPIKNNPNNADSIIEKMLEQNHGKYDDLPCDMKLKSGEYDLSAVIEKLKSKG